MGILERLAQMVGSGAQHEEPTAALRDGVAQCAARARRLRLHAGLAPQEQGASALLALAVAEEALADRLRAALQSVGADAGNGETASRPARALNHWARVVQDLEGARAAQQRFAELAVQFGESAPAVAAVFEAARHDAQGSGERLRDLVARADPQAID